MARRTGDWLLVALVVGSWAVVYARGIGDGLHTQQGFIDIRPSPAAAGDYPTVQTGPLGPAGFLPGDRRIADAHPELGAHLSATIRRGYTCAYQPDPRDLANWEV